MRRSVHNRMSRSRSSETWIRISAPTVVLAVLVQTFLIPFRSTEGDTVKKSIVVEDFDQYKVGGIPTEWKRFKGKGLAPLTPDYMLKDEYFVVKQEDGRKFVRVFTDKAVIRIVRPNGEGFNWNLRTHPRLRWDWRALKLPANAREDHLNDTGAALYVTFKYNFIGTPRSIKYSYSSSLPVGTVLTYSGLKVLVVASGRDGFGKWLHMERDVVADYRRFWGGAPPERPLSIMMWSDSNDSKGTAEADFDDIMLLPASANH